MPLFQKQDYLKESATGKQFVYGALAGIIGLSSGFFLQYVFSITLSKLLGVEHMGVFYSFFGIINTLAIIARLGLDRIGMKQISIFYERNNFVIVRKIVVLFSSTTIGVSLVFSVIIYIFRYAIASEMGNMAYIDTLSIMSLAIPWVALSFTLSQFLKGEKRIITASFVGLIIPYGISSISVIIANYFGVATLCLAAVFFLISFVIAALVGLVCLLPRTQKLKQDKTITRKDFLALSEGAVWIILVNIFTQATISVAEVLLGLFSSNIETAYYASAARTTMVAGLGLVGINSIVGPTAAILYSEKNQAALEDVSKMGARMSVSFSAFMGGVLLMAGDWIFSLFGIDIDSVFSIVVILLAGIFIDSLVGAVSLLHIMTGNEKYAVFISGTVITLSIPAYIIAIQNFGALGAAFVTSIGIIFRNIGLTISLRKHLGVYPVANNITGMLVYFISTVTLFFLTTHGQINKSSGFLIYLSCFPWLIFLLGFKKTDRELITNMIFNR